MCAYSLSGRLEATHELPRHKETDYAITMEYGGTKDDFSIPEDIARKFVGRVPARKRSKYLTEALAHKPSRQDEDLVRACKRANADANSAALEKEMEGIADGIDEPWEASSSR